MDRESRQRLTDDVEEVVVEDEVDGVGVRGELREARVGRVVLDQSDDVGGEQQRLSTYVEVDGGQAPRAELRRAAEQRLSACLRRQVEQDHRSVLARTDQLVLHTTQPLSRGQPGPILRNFSGCTISKVCV